ncbi:MAG: hypothetical protein C4315_02070 [Chloroflexota bacterium]
MIFCGMSRRLKSELKGIVDALPVPAAVVGRRGVVFHANRAFLAHFGSPLEPLPKALGLESAQWDRLITAGSLTLPDGRSLSTVPLGTRRFLLTLGDDGRLEGLNQLAIALCRDLTVDPIWVIGPRLVEVAGADQVVLWVRRSLAGDFEGYAWPPEAPGRIPYLGITDLDELERDPTASAWLGQFLRWSGYGAYWLRPLRVDWDRLGLLVVGRFTNRPFSAEEQARLEVAAGLITLAWHRRLLTDRLARNLAELNAFWQVANVGLVLVDAEGRVVAANPAAQELASGAGANVAGRLCRDVFPLVDDSGEPVCGRHCPLADLRNDERAAVRAYIPVPGGPRRAVLWTVAPIRDSYGRLRGWAEAIQDIGPLHAEDEARTGFISAISHELLTPVAIIKGYAVSLGQRPASRRDRVLRAGLEAIADEADRLSRLVRNLLDVAKVQAGVLRLQLAPLNLKPLIEQGVERFSKRSRRHTFVVEVPEQLPLVTADRDRIEGVLYNLLDNAVKYSPNGGTIRVSATVQGNEVVVAVSDPGVGIPYAEQERIFQPYHRVTGPNQPPVEGSGLGLFITRAVVEAHGGRIWVRSRPGRGSTFYFSLPREAPAELPAVYLVPNAQIEGKDEDAQGQTEDSGG